MSPSNRAKETPSPVKYPSHSPLRNALNRAIDAHFTTTGSRRQGGARLWLKTAIILVWGALSYIALVFLAQTWWQGVAAAVSLGLAVAGIGFNIQHDGGHRSFSSLRMGNRLTAWTLDLIGGSSYMWRFKHNILHHQYTNVTGMDDDVDAGPFLRLNPKQRRFWFHRFQHLYIWPLYAFLPPKWQWFDDFACLFAGRIGTQPIPRPRGWALAGLFIGKVLFVVWALVLPFALHPPGRVLLMYALVSLVTGVTLGTVFQLAHCVEEAEYESCPESGDRLPRPWAEHQLATTVDFSPRSRVLNWYLGGLNFQVEHHLFPKISHVHYRAIEPIVRRTCAESGVRHLSHRTVWTALASHVRHVKRLGRAA
jgi:linoleoyl-CoA desaturase